MGPPRPLTITKPLQPLAAFLGILRQHVLDADGLVIVGNPGVVGQNRIEAEQHIFRQRCRRGRIDFAIQLLPGSLLLILAKLKLGAAQPMPGNELLQKRHIAGQSHIPIQPPHQHACGQPLQFFKERIEELWVIIMLFQCPQGYGTPVVIIQLAESFQPMIHALPQGTTMKILGAQPHIGPGIRFQHLVDKRLPLPFTKNLLGEFG